VAERRQRQEIDVGPMTHGPPRLTPPRAQSPDEGLQPNADAPTRPWPRMAEQYSPSLNSHSDAGRIPVSG
jgi:hypothetical protein